MDPITLDETKCYKHTQSGHYLGKYLGWGEQEITYGDPVQMPIMRRWNSRRYQFQNGHFHQRGEDRPGQVTQEVPCEDQAEVVARYNPNKTVTPELYAYGQNRSGGGRRSRRVSRRNRKSNRQSRRYRR